MISNRWIEARKQDWSRLEEIVRRAETDGLKTLSAAELRDFGLLYRQAAADLSAVRTDAASRTLEAYLNRLVSRAHNFVYSGGRMSPAGVWRFMAYEYPRVFRRLMGYTWLSLVLFLAGALVGVLVTVVRPEFMHAMLGPRMIETIEHHTMWTDSILGAEPQNSSAIMTNNIAVCFVTFAGGILAGLLTIFEMVNNGLMIGVVATACAQHGMSLSLWSFIAAHGALELPAIFISGGAGLRLAAGLLFPGYLRRRDSLALAGRESIRLLAGTVPMLVVAGTLEAFLSPQRLPLALKFGTSAVLLLGLTVWLSEGWRGRLMTRIPASPWASRWPAAKDLFATKGSAIQRGIQVTK
jgi:uncharacterized membrane protein SpoIIM required for sporulation